MKKVLSTTLIFGAYTLSAIQASAQDQSGQTMDHSNMSKDQVSEMMHGDGGHDMQTMARYPTSLVGGHLMNKGGWMASYKFMRMDMDGNRDGTRRQSPADVRAEGFAVVPTEMTMDMHMLGAMYGATDNVTVMAMVPFLDNEMDHVAGMPLGIVEFTTKSDGIGDVKVGGLVKLMKQGNRSLHFNGLVSLPTGSIDETDLPPGQLPYPMQLGSGTFDLMPGITYTVHQSDYSWGVQALATLRIGDNDRDYTLGNQLRASSWYSREFTPSWIVNFRLDWTHWGNIDGADEELNPALVPTADPDRRGGDRLDVGIGLTKSIAGWQIGADVAIPVHQDLDGPQLETDSIIGITIKKHI